MKLLISATQNYRIQPEEKIAGRGPETKIWYSGPESSPGPGQIGPKKLKIHSDHLCIEFFWFERKKYNSS